MTAGSYLVAYFLSHLANFMASILVVAFKPLVVRRPSMIVVANLTAAVVGGFGAVWACAFLAANTFLDIVTCLISSDHIVLEYGTRFRPFRQ